MFKSDTPIASPEDDILNRNDYAERLATTIIEWDKSDSIVFAINAKWGYGKSSLLNLVKHYVKKKTQTQSPKEFLKPRTKLHARMRFNGKRIFPVDYYPWGFDDQDRIHNALFKEISKAVKWRGFDLYLLATTINIYNKRFEKEAVASLEWVIPFVLTAVGLDQSRFSPPQKCYSGS
jgi:hypothetical protein